MPEVHFSSRRESSSSYREKYSPFFRIDQQNRTGFELVAQRTEQAKGRSYRHCHGERTSQGGISRARGCLVCHKFRFQYLGITLGLESLVVSWPGEVAVHRGRLIGLHVSGQSLDVSSFFGPRDADESVRSSNKLLSPATAFSCIIFHSWST